MKRLGVPPGMLERFSGIKSRRHFDEEMPPSEAATSAGEKAIRAAEIERQLCRQGLGERARAGAFRGGVQLARGDAGDRGLLVRLRDPLSPEAAARRGLHDAVADLLDELEGSAAQPHAWTLSAS